MMPTEMVAVPEWSLWITLVTFLPYLVTLLALLVALRANEIAAYASRKTGQSADIATLNDFIFYRYVERPFKNKKDHLTLYDREGNSKVVSTLREAKVLAMHHVYDENWKIKSAHDSSCIWNKVAYQTADALEQLGVAAQCGLIPLKFLIMQACDVIVDDWLICRHWVKTYREDQGEPNYHRRHGEWLACISALYICQQWKKPDSKVFGSAVEVVEGHGGPAQTWGRLQELIRIDDTVISKITRKEIDSLIKKPKSKQR